MRLREHQQGQHTDRNRRGPVDTPPPARRGPDDQATDPEAHAHRDRERGHRMEAPDRQQRAEQQQGAQDHPGPVPGRPGHIVFGPRPYPPGREDQQGRHQDQSPATRSSAAPVAGIIQAACRLIIRVLQSTTCRPRTWAKRIPISSRPDATPTAIAAESTSPHAGARPTLPIVRASVAWPGRTVGPAAADRIRVRCKKREGPIGSDSGAAEADDRSSPWSPRLATPDPGPGQAAWRALPDDDGSVLDRVRAGESIPWDPALP